MKFFKYILKKFNFNQVVILGFIIITISFIQLMSKIFEVINK